MKAYKFLTADGVGVFSRFAWPLPDEPVPGRGSRSDVDACRVGHPRVPADDLPYWLAPALYEIELDGPLEEQAVKVVAPRGRLIRRVDAWRPETIEAYSRMCISRADELIAAAPELESWETAVRDRPLGAGPTRIHRGADRGGAGRGRGARRRAPAPERVARRAARARLSDGRLARGAPLG